MSDAVLNQFTKEETEETKATGKKLRVGIIGTGWIAESHIQSYKLQDDVEEMKQNEFTILVYKRLLMDAVEQRKELVSKFIDVVSSMQKELDTLRYEHNMIAKKHPKWLSKISIEKPNEFLQELKRLDID